MPTFKQMLLESHSPQLVTTMPLNPVRIYYLTVSSLPHSQNKFMTKLMFLQPRQIFSYGGVIKYEPA
jgi:hypothetical protein